MIRALPRTLRNAAPAAGASALVLLAACGDAFVLQSGSSGAGASGGHAPETSAGGAGATGGGAGDTGTGGGCAGRLQDDDDHDGYSEDDGDCDDCDPGSNPGALDIPQNGIDEDCSGTADDGPASCDAVIAVASPLAADGARAIGLCKAAASGWGVVDARYVHADGTTIDGGLDGEVRGHGIFSKFGSVVMPREGQRMLALSTGTARRPAQDDGFIPPVPGQDRGTTSAPPEGYPKAGPACGNLSPGALHDSMALEVTLKVPTNARSFRFAFDFFASDYPDAICQPYADYFVPILTPPPAGAPDGGIAFDGGGNPISVNADIFRVCASGSNDCPLGAAPLSGTGYDLLPNGLGGSSSWMQTTAPVTPGDQVTVLFAIWDSEDGSYDSTVLLDDFAFEPGGADIKTKPLP